MMEKIKKINIKKFWIEKKKTVIAIGVFVGACCILLYIASIFNKYQNIVIENSELRDTIKTMTNGISIEKTIDYIELGIMAENSFGISDAVELENWAQTNNQLYKNR